MLNSLTKPQSGTRAALAPAILEILQNPETPADLRDSLQAYLCDAGSGDIQLFWSLPGSLPTLEHLLEYVKAKEARGES